MERKAASDASAKQAAAAVKAAQYAEQQRLQREDQLARERERQRMAEQRQELAAAALKRTGKHAQNTKQAQQLQTKVIVDSAGGDTSIYLEPAQKVGA